MVRTLAEIKKQISMLESRFIPAEIPDNKWTPSAKQEEVLELVRAGSYTLFAGEAFAGKTVCIGFAATLPEFISQPHYRALILTGTERMLKSSGGVLWVLEQMFPDIPQNTERIIFPTGARIEFGTLPNSTSHENYLGRSYHFIAIDEAPLVAPNQLGFMPRSLRRSKNDTIPLNYLMSGNPGGQATEWLKEHYVNNDDPTRIFIASYMSDNEYGDVEAYQESFKDMSEIDRQRQLYGNWNAYLDNQLDIRLLREFTNDDQPIIRYAD